MNINIFIEKMFSHTPKKKKKEAETITDADDADDLLLLANAPGQDESLLHSLKQVARCIGLNVN